MIKEIKEQPLTTKTLISYITESGEALEFAQQLKKSRRIFIIGSGSSFHASLMGSYFLGRIASKFTIPVIAGEFSERFAELFEARDTYILVSQSGETKDTINVLDLLDKKGYENIYSVVNVPGSTIYMRTRNRFPIMSELEVSVAATKTFLNQVVGFAGLSLLVSQDRKGLEKLKRLPEFIKDTMEKTEPIVQQLAKEFSNWNSIYILGYGVNYSAALEGALKIKEVSYIHGEAYYSTEFKHGPLALIDEGQPVIFISSNEHCEKIISAINEVRVRKGKIISISNENPSLRLNSDIFIPIPEDGFFTTPILSVVVLQLLAYYLAVERGFNPDTPRNLSKTITVD